MTFTLGLAAGPAKALTVYTAGPGGLIRQLAAGFQEKTGIKVDVFQATTGKVMARLEAEAANPRADVLISASGHRPGPDQRGWLLPYESPNATPGAGALQGAVLCRPGHLGAGHSLEHQERHARAARLGRPDRPRLQASGDHARPGAVRRLAGPAAGLQNAQGEAAWKLFETLRDNGMTISGPNAQALTPVLQGAKAAVFGAVDYVSYASVEKGESVKVIFPAGGTAIAPRPMMILKTARQPDEARKFVDYVLSEEGQRAVADAWLMPARQDVAAKRPCSSDLALLPEAQGASSASRAEVLARFARIFSQ